MELLIRQPNAGFFLAYANRRGVHGRLMFVAESEATAKLYCAEMFEIPSDSWERVPEEGSPLIYWKSNFQCKKEEPGTYFTIEPASIVKMIDQETKQTLNVNTQADIEEQGYYVDKDATLTHLVRVPVWKLDGFWMQQHPTEPAKGLVLAPNGVTIEAYQEEKPS